jgi:hypothetical protein
MANVAGALAVVDSIGRTTRTTSPLGLRGAREPIPVRE